MIDYELKIMEFVASRFDNNLDGYYLPKSKEMVNDTIYMTFTGRYMTFTVSFTRHEYQILKMLVTIGTEEEPYFEIINKIKGIAKQINRKIAMDKLLDV